MARHQTRQAFLGGAFGALQDKSALHEASAAKGLCKTSHQHLKRLQSNTQSTPDLTVNLRIPFILLGLRSLPDDIYGKIYDPRTRQAKAVETLEYVFKQELSELHINVVADLPEREPYRPLPFKHDGGLEDEKSQKQMRKKRLEQSWKEWRAREDERLGKIEIARRKGDWLLQRASKRNTAWFSADEMRRINKKMIWWAPVILYRPGIRPSEHKWENELRCIMHTLNHAFNQPKPGYPFRVLTPTSCRLQLSITPGEKWTRDTGGWPLETVQKLLVALAGWEKEFTSISDVDGIHDCWSLSRFLEHRGIADVVKRKRRMWRALLKGGNEFNGLAEIWERDLNGEESFYQGMKESLWDRLAGRKLDNLIELLRQMARFEEKPGWKLATSFKLAVRDEHEEGTVEDEEDKVLVQQPIRGIPEIVFQNHRSSIDAAEIGAYTDLVATLVDDCYWGDKAKLAHLITNFRLKQKRGDLNLVDAFGMLPFELQSSTSAFFDTFLTEQTKEADLTAATGPFKSIVWAVEKQRFETRRDVPEFIKHYEKAGGFEPVRIKKLHAIMLQDEEDERKRTGQKTLEDLRREDASEAEERETLFSNSTADEQAPSIFVVPPKTGSAQQDPSHSIPSMYVSVAPQGSNSTRSWKTGISRFTPSSPEEGSREAQYRREEEVERIKERQKACSEAREPRLQIDGKVGALASRFAKGRKAVVEQNKAE